MVALLEPTNLLDDLQLLSEQRSTGKLILSNRKLTCIFHFFNGRLMYVQDNLYPVRRLKRALNCNNFTGFLSPEDLQKKEIWQTQLLYQAINKKQLRLIDIKKIISDVATECIIELGDYNKLQKKWQPTTKTELNLCQLLSLSQPEIIAKISSLRELQKQSEILNLSGIHPNLIPVLKKEISEQKFAILKQYLNGKHTIWDISNKLNKSLTEVIKLFSYFQSQKIIDLKEIKDLKITDLIENITEKKTTQKTEKKALIAVIDANELISHKYQHILGNDNYQILSINDPMRGFGRLIDTKPDVILINLKLPNVDGYTVSRFLRQSEVFQTTPIFIVTENEQEIDLSRGKIFGATDFLVKSQAENTLLNLVTQYTSKL
jgi:two-component system, chemotaxis family, response regulator PixG